MKGEGEWAEAGMRGDVLTCQEDWLHNGDKDECGSQLHEAVTQLCDTLRQQVVHVICVLYQSDHTQ